MHLDPTTLASLQAAFAHAIQAGRACLPDLGELTWHLPLGWRRVLNRVQHAFEAGDVLNAQLETDLSELDQTLEGLIETETRWEPPCHEYLDPEALSHLLRPVRTLYGERLLEHRAKIGRARDAIAHAMATRDAALLARHAMNATG